MPIYRAQGATLYVDGKPVPGEMANMEMGNEEREAWRAPLSHRRIEFDLRWEDESEKWRRLVESIELREFAPCLAEPYRSAILRRAGKLMEGE